MWPELKGELAQAVRRAVGERFGVEHEAVIEVPPRRELGDLASPAAMQLARVLKRRPRDIAQEILAAIETTGLPPAARSLVRELTVEGAGYLNFRLDRAAFVARVLAAPLISGGASALGAIGAGSAGKVIVEHTNINPNKAAHIGHLRNAVLGDVLVRALRRLGTPVEVQNYIDDTGVQLADVVVGFVDLRGMTAAEVAALPEPFDYLCWDLYGEVGRWYESQHLYEAAIGRFQRVVDDYQTTNHVPEALLRLTEVYLKLGLKDEAKRTAAVLGYNYPGSGWYEESYADLFDNGLVQQPGPPHPPDSRGFFARAWDSIF